MRVDELKKYSGKESSVTAQVETECIGGYKTQETWTQCCKSGLWNIPMECAGL